MFTKPHPFDIQFDIRHFGLWYAIYKYGWRNLWPIFIATRLR